MKYFAFGLFALILCSGQMCGTPAPTDTNNDIYDSGSPVPSTETPKGPRLVNGPGFSVTIPADFQDYQITPPLLPLTFYAAYTDNYRALVVGAQKVVLGSGQSQMQGFTARVQSAQITDSGDFLLIGHIESNDATMMDVLVAYAFLSNSDLLSVEIDSPSITTNDQLLGTNLFRTINLADTDGRQLEQLWRTYSPKLIDKTAQGLVVLEDLTAWGLPYSPTPDQTREFTSWQIGDPIHSQSYGSYFKQYELVHVGHWVPTAVQYLGMTVMTSLTKISEDRDEIWLANGDHQLLYPSELPAAWKIGDEMLIVDDGFWTHLINRTVGQAFKY